MSENCPVLSRCRALASGRGHPLAVRAYTVAFALALAAVFGLLIAGAHALLAPLRERNEQFSLQKTVLELLGVIAEGEGLSAADAGERFAARVDVVRVEDVAAGSPYTYYRAKDDNARVVFPAWGRGFWGMIHGLLGADLAAMRITGIAFTGHEETPGLGGRISEEWFRSQFAGKSLAAPDAEGRFLQVVAGRNSDPEREVDAITGATGTSKAVEALVNESVARFLSLHNPAAAACTHPPLPPHLQRGGVCSRKTCHAAATSLAGRSRGKGDGQ